MVGRLLVGFVWLNLQISVSWQVDFYWGSCGPIFSFLCHGWQTFSGICVAQYLVSVSFVGRLLVGFVWLNIQSSVSWLVDFQWGQCGSIFNFLCHGWQIFSGVRVAQSLVFCVMDDRFLVGFVWFNLQFSVSWQVDFQWGSCGSIFRCLCHGRQTFSGVRVAQSLLFCHGRQTFSGVHVAQSLVFCVMVVRLLGGVRVAQSFVFCVMAGRLLVGFVWLNLVFCIMVGRLLMGFVWFNQFSVSWQVDFLWDSCGSFFSLLCHGRQTFSGVRVGQSLVFCVMVGRLLVGFVWLNLQSSVSWQVDFQWGSCYSIFGFLCHGWQTFSGVRVAQSLVFCHCRQSVSGVRVAQYLVFCVMVGRLLVGLVWLNLWFSASWLEDFQWCSCGSISTFLSWLVDFQWGSCGSIFSFLCHGWKTFIGVRVAQSFAFCVMVGRLLVGFVWLNLQISVSWQVDFYWGSCGPIFSFLCHGWQTFSGICVAQYLVSVSFVGRLLVGFVWLNIQSSVSWLVDFQWGQCGSIFSFLCHGWKTFSGVRVAQSLLFCHGRQTFSGVHVAQSLVFCVMVGRLLGGVRVAQSFVFCVMAGRLLVGFVWLNLVFCVMVGRLLMGFVWFNQFSVSWQVDFLWDSCGSFFSLLCHGRQTFSGVRVGQSLVFCVMVGRLLVGFVCLNLQFSVSWQVDFQWGSCGSIFNFPCPGMQTFSGVRVAQSLVFSVMVGRLLVGFVWLNLQFSVSWLVDFQWASCVSIFRFLCHGWQTFSGVRVAQSPHFRVIVGQLFGVFVWLNLQFSVSWQVDFQGVSCGSIFSLLCHGRQTFSGVRVTQSFVFCVMVGRLLVGFVSLNLQFSVSLQVDCQWGSCGSIFSLLCHGWQTFSGVSVAQSLVFCVIVGRLLVVFVWLNLYFSVMVGRLLVGFMWLNLQFSVSWLEDFYWSSRGSIFCFLCYGWQTFSGIRVVQYLVFCVMVGRLLVGFVLLNLLFSVSWLVDFQWGSCGSIFSFLCHCRQTFRRVRVAQYLVFCVMVGRLLVGFVWLNLQFSVSWLEDFQWCSCGSISTILSWQVDFQWGSCGSIFSFLCHGWQTFSGVRVAQSFAFCVMVGRLLVGFV